MNRDFRSWHVWDMPGGPDDVCLSGKTGSGRRIVKPTRMTDAVEKVGFSIWRPFSGLVDQVAMGVARLDPICSSRERHMS